MAGKLSERKASLNIIERAGEGEGDGNRETITNGPSAYFYERDNCFPRCIEFETLIQHARPVSSPNSQGTMRAGQRRINISRMRPNRVGTH